MVGRQRERAVLLAALTDARDHRGGVVLLTGDGGMGKTTLADELAAAAAALGVHVVRGHGWEGVESPPLVVWREVLTGLGDSGTGPVDGERVLRRLRGAQTPVLVLVEDLHAADADSARALAYLSSRLSSLPVLVLATFREHELTRRPGAVEALRSVSTHCRRLPVPALTALGVAELAAALHGAPVPTELVSDLVRRSDGNAFYVRELIESAGGSDVPPGITASVHDRLAALPPDVVRLLRAAACAGRHLDVRLLAAATGTALPAALDLLGAAVTAGLIEDQERGRLRFRHALVAEVLQAGLTPAERARHHLDLATALQGTPGVHAVAVAHHLVEAGPLASPVDVAGWSRQAAEQAEAAGAPLEAVRHLQAAVEHTQDDALRARLHERTGHCLFNAGTRTAEAIYSFELALAGYDATGQARRSGIVHSRLGSHLALYRRTGDFSRAARHFAAAGELLTNPLDRAHLLVGTSTLALLAGRPRDALADAQEAERSASRAGRTALAATGRLMTGASLLALGRLTEGFAALDASFSPGLVVRPTVDVQTAWHGITTGVALEDPELACSYARRGERGLEGVFLPGQAQILSDLLAPAYALGGDVGRARTSLAADDLLGFDVQRLGVIPAYAGDWETVVPALEQMLHRETVAGQGARLAVLSVTLGWVLRLQGEYVRARNHLLPALRDAERDGRVLDAVRLGIELALVEVACADPDRARPYVESAGGWVGREDLRGLGVRWELALAAVAETDFERLLDEADRRGLPFLALDVLHQWRCAAPERGSALTALLADRLDRLGLRGTGWEVLVSSSSARPAGGIRSQRLSLRRQGDVWVLEGGSSCLRLRDSKGLRHLARLIASPDREWWALDLVALEAGTAAAGEASQPAIDEVARRAYSTRLAALREAEQEAQADGNAVRADRARAEREALEDHLLASTGLGGRSRNLSGPGERARQSVTKTIWNAVERIHQQDRLLGDHLRTAVRTGSCCTYRPDPASTFSSGSQP